MSQFQKHPTRTPDSTLFPKFPDDDSMLLRGPVLKRRSHSSEGRGLVQCGHFSDKRDDLQMRTSAHFGPKTFGLFEIYGIFSSTWTRGERGVEPVRTFCGQGREIDFSRFCADVFLWWPRTKIFRLRFFPKMFKKYSIKLWKFISESRLSKLSLSKRGRS